MWHACTHGLGAHPQTSTYRTARLSGEEREATTIAVEQFLKLLMETVVVFQFTRWRQQLLLTHFTTFYARWCRVFRTAQLILQGSTIITFASVVDPPVPAWYFLRHGETFTIFPRLRHPVWRTSSNFPCFSIPRLVCFTTSIS